MSDTGRYLTAFLRDPLHTASITPSSPDVAAVLAAAIPPDGTVLELGPGTGSVSAALATATTGRRIAIELVAEWAQLLARRDPDLEVIHGDVHDLDALLDARGIGQVDAVISGLPWAAFAPRPDRPPLITRLAARLTDTGSLRQLGYAATRFAPPARRQLTQLRTSFTHVSTSRTVWRNLPPAVVHLAQFPRR